MELLERLLCLLRRCFTAQAEADKTHTSAASGLDACLFGCEAADLMFTTSSHAAGLCARSMQGWLGSQFWPC